MEGFFRKSAETVSEEIESAEEFLWHRYHTDKMLEWEPSRFIGFYRVAKKKELEEKVYIQWVGMLPQLSKYTSFVEFYDMMTGASIDTRPKDEIINEIYELHGVKNDGK